MTVLLILVAIALAGMLGLVIRAGCEAIQQERRRRQVRLEQMAAEFRLQQATRSTMLRMVDEARRHQPARESESTRYRVEAPHQSTDEIPGASHQASDSDLEGGSGPSSPLGPLPVHETAPDQPHYR